MKKLFVGNLELTVSGETNQSGQNFVESHDLQHFVSGVVQLLMPNGEVIKMKVEAVDGQQIELEETEEIA